MSGSGSEECLGSDAGRPVSLARSRNSSEDAGSTGSLSPRPHVAVSAADRLREEVRKARKDDDTEEVLQVIAENSGWTMEQVAQHPETITSVELFLLTLPRIPQLRLFPNLTSVKLMHIGLTSMEDLADLTCVEELWLSDNYIRKIESLEKMTKLRRLYLQGNEITSLDGLPPLKHLRELWLCRNKIRHVDGQRHLLNVRRLRSLWLACNPISSLEGAFPPLLTHLHEVNLAGCGVYCFSQLAQLQPLTGTLRRVWFADPIFGENPVCRLNNYATLAIHLLGPGLEQLDGEDIGDEQRLTAASLYEKKYVYYSMRLHTLERNVALLRRHAESVAAQRIGEAVAAADELAECLAPVRGCVRERRAYGGRSTHARLGSVELTTLETAERDLSRAVDTREVHVQSLQRRLAEAVSVSEGMAERLQERLCVELHSGGNVRLEEVAPAPPQAQGSPTPDTAGGGGSNGQSGASGGGAGGSRGAAARTSAASPAQLAADTNPTVSSAAAASTDGYYESATELLQAGFEVTSEAFRERFGIAGVEVRRVHRIVNRGLRLRFDDRLRALEIDMASPSNRRKMVCLFSPVAGEADEQGAYLRHVLQRGMDMPERRRGGGGGGGAAQGSPAAAGAGPGHGRLPHQAQTTTCPPPMSEGVPLTNSLFLADEARLLAAARRGELTGVNANPNVLTGQIIFSRVFLGKSVQALGGSRGSLLGSPAGTSMDGSAAAGAFLSPERRVFVKDYATDVFSAYRTPALGDLGATSAAGGGSGAGTLAQEPGARVWYGLDRALILPEFVVDYTYTLARPPGVAALLHSAPALTVATNPVSLAALRAQLRAVLPGLDAATTAGTAWTDLHACAYPMLAFLISASDGAAVSASAREETERVLAAARELLGGEVGHRSLATSTVSILRGARAGGARVGSASTSRTSAASESSAAERSRSLTGGSLTAAVVAAYGEEVGSEMITYCQLRARGIRDVPKEFSTSAFVSLSTLDLSSNGMTSFSWFAIAQAAPNLDSLALQHNALTGLELHGTRLPSLTTLNLSHNALRTVDEFAEVPACLPQLRHLCVRHNPMLSGGMKATFQLLACFTGSSLETLDDVRLAAARTPSIAGWRLERSLDLANPATLGELVRRAAAALSAPGSAILMDTSDTAADKDGLGFAKAGDGALMCYDMTSLDPSVPPRRYFESALRSMLGGDSGSTGGFDSGNGGHVRTPSTAGLTLPPPARSIAYSGSLMNSLSFVRQLPRLADTLRHLTLRSHSIADLTPVQSLERLERLDVADNCVAVLPDLSGLAHLTTLDVSLNALTSITEMGTPPALECLCVHTNHLHSLDTSLLAQLESLRELYVANNALTNLSEFYILKDKATLVTIDVSGNPFQKATAEASNKTPAAPGKAAPQRLSSSTDLASKRDGDTRTYFIYLFRHLKVLDGVPISQAEVQRARDSFAGKISSDLLAERAPVPATAWATLASLDLSQCALHEVALLEPFAALERLNLSRNALTRLQGLSVLRQLRTLDLGFNRLGTASALAIGEALSPLVNLESLSLESNRLTDLNAVGLQLPQLKFLNLKSNELQFLDRGLQRLPQLRELIVDHNRLRSLSADCFAACGLLTDFSAEDNAIRATDGLARLSELQRVNLGVNRLTETRMLLTDLQSSPVREAIFIGNPLARKTNYRATVIAGMPTLGSLDKKPIAREERERAEAMMRQQEQYAVPANVIIDMSFMPNLANPQQQQQQMQMQMQPQIPIQVPIQVQMPMPLQMQGNNGLGSAAGGGPHIAAGGGGGPMGSSAQLPRASGQRLQAVTGKRPTYYFRGGSVAGRGGAGRL